MAMRRIGSSKEHLVQPEEAAQDEVFRWLKKHVASLPRHEGIFLTEAEVAKATGRSRTPVREAMLRLEADGLLKIVPKKGAFVPPITDAQIEAVMQARTLVEDWCVRRACRFGDTLAAELERLVAEQEALRDSPMAFIERDREFHRAIVWAANNPILAEFYEGLRERQLRMGLQAIGTSVPRVDDVLAEHRAIIAALKSGDGKRAAAAMARHLANTLTTLQLPFSASRWQPGPVDPSGH